MYYALVRLRIGAGKVTRAKCHPAVGESPESRSGHDAETTEADKHPVKTDRKTDGGWGVGGGLRETMQMGAERGGANSSVAQPRLVSLFTSVPTQHADCA